MVKIKKGDIFYTAWINVESDPKEKSSVELTEHFVVNINKNGIAVREKNYCTWGRLSKAHGDYGWLPQNIYSRMHHNKTYQTEDELKADLYCSKSAAYRSVLLEAREYKKDATRILAQVTKAINKYRK